MVTQPVALLAPVRAMSLDERPERSRMVWGGAGDGGRPPRRRRARRSGASPSRQLKESVPRGEHHEPQRVRCPPMRIRRYATPIRSASLWANIETSSLAAVRASDSLTEEGSDRVGAPDAAAGQRSTGASPRAPAPHRPGLPLAARSTAAPLPTAPPVANAAPSPTTALRPRPRPRPRPTTLATRSGGDADYRPTSTRPSGRRRDGRVR